MQTVNEYLWLKILSLLLLFSYLTISTLFREKLYKLFETKSMHKPLLIGNMLVCLLIIALSYTLLVYYLNQKPYRMNLFKRFGLLWDIKLKPHCKHCFVLMNNIPTNQHLIHCPTCNKSMKIFNDKENKDSTVDECIDKFRKGI